MLTRRREAAKDAVEPERPDIVRSEVANHQLVPRSSEDADVCSGKGLEVSAAWASALGEAVERYSSAVHNVLTQLFLDQSYVANTAAIFVISAFLHRSMHKYLDRGYRYVLLEAGHVAQNLNLASTAIELGSFNLGGFFDGFLAQLFALDLDQEVPLYAVALGQPASADRVASRLAEGVL